MALTCHRCSKYRRRVEQSTLKFLKVIYPGARLLYIVDHEIYNNLSVPQSHVINYNGVRGPITSSCSSDHEIYCLQEMKQQHQHSPHSRNHSQSSQSGLLSSRGHHNLNQSHNNSNNKKNHHHQHPQLMYNNPARTQAPIPGRHPLQNHPYPHHH